METTLDIGDVRVAFALPPTFNPQPSTLWEAAHARFLTGESGARPADVALRVHRGQVPSRPDPATAMLDNDLWRLYLMPDGGAAVEVLATPARNVDLWTVLGPDFAAGDVYLGLEPDETPYPLGYPLTQVVWTLLLGQGRGLTVHSCGVDDRGQGLLFAGMSGAGKSTTARLWDGVDGATVLSDDRIVLRREGGLTWMYGTPWHGDAERAVPRRVPLSRVYILAHGEGENRLTPLSPAAAAAALLVRATPPVWDSEGIAFTLQFLHTLLADTPAAGLSFLPTRDIVDFVRADAARGKAAR
jgi:hypothetical protein